MLDHILQRSIKTSLLARQTLLLRQQHAAHQAHVPRAPRFEHLRMSLVTSCYEDAACVHSRLTRQAYRCAAPIPTVRKPSHGGLPGASR